MSVVLPMVRRALWESDPGLDECLGSDSLFFGPPSGVRNVPCVEPG
jgi:hypothetical protein